MKKLTNILLASALAVSLGSALALGFNRTNTEEINKVSAEETPDGSILRPYLINSYQDLKTIGNVAADGKPHYYSLNESWIYEENLNNNYISITNSNTGESKKKIIWLDLNGKRVIRKGNSTDNQTFYISGNVELNLYDSTKDVGMLSVWFDDHSNDSCLFYVTGGAHLNFINGNYEYTFDYNGAQFAHDGDLVWCRSNDDSLVNFYDGKFGAANCVLYANNASKAKIHDGYFYNLRTYQQDTARTIFWLDSGAISNMVLSGTTIYPTADLTGHLLAGPRYEFFIGNSSIIYSSLNSTTTEIEINQGEEAVIQMWVSAAISYKWSFYPTTISVDGKAYLETFGPGNNVFHVKSDYDNVELDDAFLYLAVKFEKNGSETTKEYTIHFTVNQLYEKVTFDLQGHGDNISTWVDTADNVTIAEIIDYGYVDNEDQYYLLGFAKKPMSQFADKYAFARAAAELYDSDELITGPLTLYAGWEDYHNKFGNSDVNKLPANFDLAVSTDMQTIGTIFVSNLPALSVWYSYIKVVFLRIQYSGLVNGEEVIPFELYYKLEDQESYTAITSGSSYTFINLTNKNDGTSKVIEIAAKIPNLSLRDNTLDYVSNLSYCIIAKDSDNATCLQTVEQEPTVTLKQDAVVEYTMSFSAGEGGSGSMDPITKASGQTIVLPDCTFTAPSGKEFQCWSIDGVSYAEGADYVITSNVTAIAIWRDIPPVPVVLESISLSGTHQTEFVVGDTFSYEGLVVTAHYSDDTSLAVGGFAVDSSSVNMAAVGTYTVTVSYTESTVTKTASYQVTVSEAPVDPEEPTSESETPSEPSKKKGCGGSIIATSAVLSVISLAGLGLLILKKRKEK